MRLLFWLGKESRLLHSPQVETKPPNSQIYTSQPQHTPFTTSNLTLLSIASFQIAMSSPTPNPNPQPPNSSSPRNPRAVFSRGEQISARVQRLEKTCSKIHQCQRWPTQKSIRAYQHSLLVPKIHVSPPPQPQGYFHWWGGQITRPREEELAEILAPALNAKVEFPVPVRKGWKSEETEGGGGKAGKNEEREGFELFSLLPTEIRTQIWESEIRRPKFIEAQVSTAYGKPAFVGHCTKRSPLLSACRESREIALGEKYESLACRLSFKEWWQVSSPNHVERI